MNKLLFTLFAITATAMFTFAEDGIHHNGDCNFAGNTDRISCRDINRRKAKRNGRKPVANLHAKISAAQADALRYAAKIEQAHRPTISVYSNITPRPADTQSPGTTSDNGHNITINNSSVIINN